jgi:alkanesulfonate monooxygenase SsuD/methylene tetrahydromethanopterin reductase-like flavin-dependent oxidoreductase (luciferase family)
MFERISEIADAAEGSGFDSFWVMEEVLALKLLCYQSSRSTGLEASAGSTIGVSCGASA